MLLQRNQIRLHLPFAFLALVLVIGCAVWYVVDSRNAEQWLGGGSTVGLACGVIAAAIIAFEMLLWPRKLLRRLRLFPTKYWLAAHLWIGLASFPLAILHSGFHLGGFLPATLMILFALTIFSGVYGWAIQNILPKWLLRNLPAETIYSQIDHVAELAAEDAKRMLIASCGQRRTMLDVSQLDMEEMDLSLTQTIVIGAVRQAGKGRTSGRTLQTKLVNDSRDDRDRLWTAFDNIEDFLIEGGTVTSPVTDRREASIWFNRLRKDCGADSHGVIDALEELCDQRRQFDTQAVVHRWLHAWLPLHIGLSVSVSVLLVVHIWTALKYW
ncbi:hypothetical protein [Aporhodopirellula aestuarii]|uniref:Uncharacterized protein n=1 Tax=Aporhodopirellula aestuarii TaxID=2950107 RepID=A0ABT0UC80_9BACT|nr:hypothetical protein [Aporhodopirellula aestuarii]MCM2374623.1 hypothetical protein [Aporhodopirellula aestuarii]